MDQKIHDLQNKGVNVNNYERIINKLYHANIGIHGFFMTSSNLSTIDDQNELREFLEIHGKKFDWIGSGPYLNSRLSLNGTIRKDREKLSDLSLYFEDEDFLRNLEHRDDFLNWILTNIDRSRRYSSLPVSFWLIEEGNI